jgi:hypothetical protein
MPDFKINNLAKKHESYSLGHNVKVVLGRFFNFKLERFATKSNICTVTVLPHLELKTRSDFYSLGSVLQTFLGEGKTTYTFSAF